MFLQAIQQQPRDRHFTRRDFDCLRPTKRPLIAYDITCGATVDSLQTTYELPSDYIPFGTVVLLIVSSLLLFLDIVLHCRFCVRYLLCKAFLFPNAAPCDNPFTVDITGKNFDTTGKNSEPELRTGLLTQLTTFTRES